MSSSTTTTKRRFACLAWLGNNPKRSRHLSRVLIICLILALIFPLNPAQQVKAFSELEPGKEIRLKVSGEAGSKVFLNDQNTNQIIPSTGSIDIATEKAVCGKVYSYKITLQDAVGNFSEAETINLKAKACPRPTTKIQVVNNTSSFIGNENDVWGGKNKDSLGEFELKVEIRQNGDYKIIDSTIPAPVITYLTTTNDNTAATVYGVAMPKRTKGNLRIKYETGRDFGMCLKFWGCSSWKDEYRQIEVEHSSVEILKSDKNQYVDRIWNDTSNGQWRMTLDLQNGKAKVNDEIYAKTVVYGKYKYQAPGIKEVEIDYGVGKNWSEGSNRVKLASPKLEQLKETIRVNFGIEVFDGNKKWSETELNWTIQAMEILPEKVRKQDTIKKLGRESVGGKGSLLGGCLGGEKDSSISGCYDGKKTLWVFDNYTSYGNQNSKYGPTTTIEEGYKINLIHEIAHGYHNANGNILSKFDDISWTNKGALKNGATGCDFITGYAMTNNKEDFAETYGVYYIKEDRFLDYFNNSIRCINPIDTWEKSDLNKKSVFPNNN
jgi:hypothetical protein